VGEGVYELNEADARTETWDRVQTQLAAFHVTEFCVQALGLVCNFRTIAGKTLQFTPQPSSDRCIRCNSTSFKAHEGKIVGRPHNNVWLV
jgi:hypothetical protein